MEFSKIIADFTPGAVGIWTGILMFAVYFLKEYRETRKLSVEDRLARRDGYARQVESLMAENRSLRTDLADLERRHNDYRRLCQNETDQLRQEMQRLEDEIVGIRRSEQAARSALRRLPPTASADVLHAAERTQSYLAGERPEGEE